MNKKCLHRLRTKSAQTNVGVMVFFYSEFKVCPDISQCSVDALLQFDFDTFLVDDIILRLTSNVSYVGTLLRIRVIA